MDVSEDTNLKVSPRMGETSKVEPGDLLEEGWFFGNLLDRKSRTMSRCFSDPCPSSKVSQEMLVGKSYEETFSSINKLVFPGDRGRGRGRGRGSGSGSHDVGVVSTPPQPHPSLMRTPSMPSPNRSNSSRVQVQTPTTTTTSSSNNRIQRTPSLPAMDLDVDNSEDEESEYSMGNLIRQASLGQSRTLPPRQNMSKNLIPKQQYPRRKAEQEGARRQHITKREKTKSGLGNVETEKVIKDLKGSDIESPIKEIKILPKLQEMRITEENTSYIEEARRLKRTTSASPVLTSDDMKAQLKFWARAVASNVR